MMERISNRALISRLYSSAEHQLEKSNYDGKSWEQWYQIVQGLTGPEKMVYIMVKLNQTVTSGGFAKFYETSHGIFAPEIIHVLSEINAASSASIVTSTLSIVNPSGLLDQQFKSFIFNIQLSDMQKEKLFAQDIQYDQLDGIENLEDLLGNYLQNSINQ